MHSSARLPGIHNQCPQCFAVVGMAAARIYTLSTVVMSNDRAATDAL